MRQEDTARRELRTAAEWFAVRRGPRDAGLERRFEHWLAAAPRNAEDYALCDLTWELSAEAAAGLESGNVSRWRMVWWAASAVAACAAAAVFLLQGRDAVDPQLYSTAPGEMRSIALSDGSRIVLNTRSTVSVSFDERRRDVRLGQGEAYFEVARDPERPFVVSTSLGSARAVGTRFNVMQLDGRVEVSTEEGRVLVEPLHAAGTGVLATAGVRATLLPGAARPSVGPADLNRIENWRARRLEFDRVELADALAEISRYTTVPIRAADDEVGGLRISAVLKVGDVDALRVTLDGALGLELVAGEHEWVVTMRTERLDASGS